MRIEKLDCSWFATPFFRHRMAVTSMEQVEQLKACGVETLDISGELEADSVATEEVIQEPSEAIDPSPVLTAPPEVTGIPFEEELPAAKLVYTAAKNVIEEAMLDVRMGRDINMDAVNQVVSEMADSVLRNPDALTSLSRLKHFDEYTFFHSVNTSLLALSLGRNLGIDEALLHQLGVGTLLHDIGKTKVPLEILNKPGKYEAHEFEIMKQHVMRGAEVLSGTTGLTDNYQSRRRHHGAWWDKPLSAPGETQPMNDSRRRGHCDAIRAIFITSKPAPKPCNSCISSRKAILNIRRPTVIQIVGLSVGSSSIPIQESPWSAR